VLVSALGLAVATRSAPPALLIKAGEVAAWVRIAATRLIVSVVDRVRPKSVADAGARLAQTPKHELRHKRICRVHATWMAAMLCCGL
jgi:hypothetical protein